jgi:hypothetical protein
MPELQTGAPGPLLGVAVDIIGILEDAVPRLSALGERGALVVRLGGGWSVKEILGHLIDSAANNHQRFVRAQLQRELVFPSYEQDRWVAVQGHSERPFAELVALWDALNRHVAHVVARIPAEKVETPCRIGDGPAVTLEFVARDYVRHLRHHLEQILEPEKAAGKRFGSAAEPQP